MRRRTGFTLVEMLVGLVVITILATIAFFGYNTWQGRVYRSVLVSDLKRFATEEEQVRSARGTDSTWAFSVNPRVEQEVRLSRPEYYYMELRHAQTDQTCWLLMRPTRPRGNGVPYCDSPVLVEDTIASGMDTLLVATMTGPDSVETGTPVTFDASGSLSVGSPITEYAFTGLGGADQTGLLSTLTTTFASVGTRTVSLAVRNGRGQERTVTRTLRVVAAQPPAIGAPTATFTLPATVSVGDAVALDGQASTAAAGATLVSWVFDGWEGGPLTGATQTTTFATPGTRALRLTVTDDGGRTGSVVRTLTVLDTLLLPVLNAPATVQAGQSFVLDASASQVAAGRSITEYRFSGVPSGVLSGPQATRTVAFAVAGTQTVTLTVFDDAGRTRQVSRQIEVTALAPPVTPSYTLTVVPDSIGVGGLTRALIRSTAEGLPIGNLPVTIETANPDLLTITSPASGVTDPSGEFEATFTGAAVGNALIRVVVGGTPVAGAQSIVRIRAVAPQGPVLVPLIAPTQTGRTGATVQGPRVAVLDSATWAPMSGVEVTFASGPTGGALAFLAASSDPSGEAGAGTWTLGATADEYTATASIPGQTLTFIAVGEDLGSAPAACLTLTPTNGPGGTTVTASCGCSSDPDGPGDLDVCVFTGLPTGTATIPYSPTASVTFALPPAPRPRQPGEELPALRIDLEVRDQSYETGRASAMARVTPGGQDPAGPCVVSLSAPPRFVARGPHLVTVSVVDGTFQPVANARVTVTNSGVAAAMTSTPDVTDAAGVLPLLVTPAATGTLTLTATTSCGNSTLTRTIEAPGIGVTWRAPTDTVFLNTTVWAEAELFDATSLVPLHNVPATIQITDGANVTASIGDGTATEATDPSARLTAAVQGLSPGLATLQVFAGGSPVGAPHVIVIADRPSVIGSIEYVGWGTSSGSLTNAPTSCQVTGGCLNTDFGPLPTSVDPPDFFGAGSTVTTGYRFLVRGLNAAPLPNALVLIQPPVMPEVTYTGPLAIRSDAQGYVEIPPGSLQFAPTLTGMNVLSILVRDPAADWWPVANVHVYYMASRPVCAQILSGFEDPADFFGNRIIGRSQSVSLSGRIEDCISRSPVANTPVVWVVANTPAPPTQTDGGGYTTHVSPPPATQDYTVCLIPLTNPNGQACINVVTPRVSGHWEWAWNHTSGLGHTPFSFRPTVVTNMPIRTDPAGGVFNWNIPSPVGEGMQWYTYGDVNTVYRLGALSAGQLCGKPSQAFDLRQWTPATGSASVRLINNEVYPVSFGGPSVPVTCSPIELAKDVRRQFSLETLGPGPATTAVYHVCVHYRWAEPWLNPTAPAPADPIPSPGCDSRLYYIHLYDAGNAPGMILQCSNAQGCEGMSASLGYIVNVVDVP